MLPVDEKYIAKFQLTCFIKFNNHYIEHIVGNTCRYCYISHRTKTNKTKKNSENYKD